MTCDGEMTPAKRAFMTCDGEITPAQWAFMTCEGEITPAQWAFYDGQWGMDARQRGRFMMGNGEWTATDELSRQT